MVDRYRMAPGLRRREFVGGALALGAVSALSPPARAAAGPWAVRPPGKVDKLNFVVWTYGDIYTKISKKFTADWGVPVEATISAFTDHPTKLMTMYAGGETIDVSQSSPTSFANFISQGLVAPLDGLPGAAGYLQDLTHSAEQVAVQNGKFMALPYYSTVYIWTYNADLLKKAGLAPFKTYDELLEQLRKAKKDGIATHPILWVGGVGGEAASGTWYQLTWNRGGTFFDKNGHHQLGPGSVARETLKWWVKTFAEGLSDPESIRATMVSSAKTFSSGKNLYRGPSHHYTLELLNDPAQSPIAGKARAWGSPGDGKTIGSTSVYFLCTATRNREWAWKLLQYLGGRTKDGEYSQAVALARDAMLGSGYRSVMHSAAVTEGWRRWGDPVKLLAIWDKASYFGAVCNAVYKPWYLPWNDRINIEVEKALTGQITADQCCDALIAALKEVRKT